jgi:signal transduction histidine kinase/CheY-like chemotaxis protein
MSKTIATFACMIFFCVANCAQHSPGSQRLISVTWYLMLLYCLPVTATFSLLISNCHTFWQMNSVFCNLALSLVTSWYTFVCLNVLGSIIGYIIYFFVGGNWAVNLSDESSLVIYNYTLNIIICYLLIYSKDYNLKMLKKIQERLSSINNQLQKKVNQKTGYLKDSLAAKEKFLNNISHEMRTPMQGVYGVAQELREKWDSLPDDKKLYYLDLIVKSSERLISLFCNLLDLGKLNANQMSIEAEKADLYKVMQDIITELEALSMVKNVPVTLHKDEQVNSVTKFDKIRIAQVIRNLISNAIKYCDSGEINVTISIDSRNKNYLLTQIKDSGIGIPENELGVIFLPFTQSTKTKTNAGGTGLGLSICAEIINLHNGKIWAENNIGGGASFFFSLPILRDDNQSIDAVVQKINSLGSVMILDDEALATESGAIILSSIGFNVISAMDCNEALAKLEANKVCILFLDMMMPDMSGLEFLKLLRKDRKYDDVKVIIMSGMCDTKDIKEAVLIGAIAYFSKPYNKAQIYEGVMRHFSHLVP